MRFPRHEHDIPHAWLLLAGSAEVPALDESGTQRRLTSGQ